MRTKERFWELGGYRLPTEAEWEYFCRAGTTTSRYYGTDDGLLNAYAWYHANGENQTWPVARLKPNDFGLFDVLGNLWEWCHDPKGDYPKATGSPSTDTPDGTVVQNTSEHVLRGGAFTTLPADVRSGKRNFCRADDHGSPWGVRPVRTLP